MALPVIGLVLAPLTRPLDGLIGLILLPKWCYDSIALESERSGRAKESLVAWALGWSVAMTVVITALMALSIVVSWGIATAVLLLAAPIVVGAIVGRRAPGLGGLAVGFAGLVIGGVLAGVLASVAAFAARQVDPTIAATPGGDLVYIPLMTMMVPILAGAQFGLGVLVTTVAARVRDSAAARPSSPTPIGGEVLGDRFRDPPLTVGRGASTGLREAPSPWGDGSSVVSTAADPTSVWGLLAWFVRGLAPLVVELAVAVVIGLLGGPGTNEEEIVVWALLLGIPFLMVLVAALRAPAGAETVLLRAGLLLGAAGSIVLGQLAFAVVPLGLLGYAVGRLSRPERARGDVGRVVRTLAVFASVALWAPVVGWVGVVVFLLVTNIDPGDAEGRILAAVAAAWLVWSLIEAAREWRSTPSLP